MWVFCFPQEVKHTIKFTEFLGTTLFLSGMKQQQNFSSMRLVSLCSILAAWGIWDYLEKGSELTILQRKLSPLPLQWLRWNSRETSYVSIIYCQACNPNWNTLVRCILQRFCSKVWFEQNSFCWKVCWTPNPQNNTCTTEPSLLTRRLVLRAPLRPA